ncbi:MAG TPA: hypothetical protein VM841_04465 [Actinomycetota bacterium]|nr:hypothetical protein [Actinomycetota bacterium]
MKRPTLRLGAGILMSAMLALPVVFVPREAHAATYTVLARDDGFFQTSIEIRPGDSVIWKNDGQITHTIDAQSGAPQPSPRQLAPKESTNPLTLSTLGNYKYRLDGRSLEGYEMTVKVTNNPSSPSPSPTATGTITITTTPTSTPTRRRTSSPTPTKTTSSPSPSPSPSTPTPTPTTPTPTPTPTEPTDSASPIPSFDDDTTGSPSSGNSQAIIAILGVLVLGALGFVVYRRTLSG